MSQKHLLDVDLEHYSVTARAVLNLKPPAKRLGELTLYTAAAGSALALAPGAEASIIYSGIKNITISIDKSVAYNPSQIHITSKFNQAISTSVNLNNDGGGIKFRIYSSGPPPAPGTSSTEMRNVAAAYGAGGLAFLGDSFPVAKFNASTANINSKNSPWNNGGNLRWNLHARAHLGSAGIHSTLGNWNPGVSGKVEGFAGIKFANDDLGWLRFDLTTGGSLGRTLSLTLVDWAYQSVPGASIHVGDTGSTPSVPEPSTLGLMALGATGIAMLRRRQNSGKDAEQQAH